MKEFLTPHPEEQRNLAELRSEYRSLHRNQLRSQMSKHPVGWGVIGDPEKSRLHYSSQDWAVEMLVRLDESVTTDFGLSAVPDSEGKKLEEQAQKALLHEQVTWDDGPGVVDHDSPPCKYIGEMSDEEIVAYVDRAIEESKNAL